MDNTLEKYSAELSESISERVNGIILSHSPRLYRFLLIKVPLLRPVLRRLIKFETKIEPMGYIGQIVKVYKNNQLIAEIKIYFN